MHRNFVGYGEKPPQFVWPHHARIAVNFVLNYEEGSERCILDGDDGSESYLTDLPDVAKLMGQRHLSVESLFEYGSRAGIWRLLHLFDEYDLPITLFVTGLALERNPELAQKLRKSHHEVAGHGYRWIDYRLLSEQEEGEHIAKTIHAIQDLTQKKVQGWYTGRRSVNTRNLLIEAGMSYNSDSYSDDLPYWTQESGNRPHLIIPYTLDTNDFRYTTSPGWSDGNDFYHYLKATFDCLYREGASHPKMMTIGLHARLSGRPGRCEAVRRFIDYIRPFDNVWVCRREEIADFWRQHHKFN